MNNQAAFPLVEPVNSGDTVHTGMSLRDYFAGQAMEGQLAGDAEWDLHQENHVTIVARNSYRMADAMLEVRNVP